MKVSPSSTTSEAEFYRLVRTAKLSHFNRDPLTLKRISTEYFSTGADDLRVSTARGTDSEAQAEYFFEGLAAFVGISRLTGRVPTDQRKRKSGAEEKSI